MCMPEYNSLRLLRWAAAHPEEWGILCGEKRRISEEEFNHIAGQLLKENFSEAYLILFSRFAKENNLLPQKTGRQDGKPPPKLV